MYASPCFSVAVQRHSAALRKGFTLIEMLVALTLVLLMMSLFAQVFQFAGSTVSQQRGMMENDQRARSLQTLIKADLDKRTFRRVIPFFPGEQVDARATEADLAQRQGYLYISENDPLNESEDLLQFTVSATQSTRFNADTTSYFGKASALGPQTSNPTDPTGPSFLSYADQPAADDGTLIVDGSSSSPAAEVAYFLRGGNLYRRVLLLRDPVWSVGSDEQPSDTGVVGGENTDPFLLSGTPSATRAYSDTDSSFWNDFDFSAYYRVNAGNADGAAFNSIDTLYNGTGTAAEAIANPARRFGFDHVTGRSKEFLTNAGVFFGRFTMEETSNSNFRYPHRNCTTVPANPMSPTSALSLDPTLDRPVVQGLAGGPRRGEDLLLTNVLAFDVEVWDEGTNNGLGGWTDLLSVSGDFSAANRADGGAFGPDNTTPANNRVFDTWHWSVDLDGVGGNDLPPYRPRTFKPTNEANPYGSGATIPNWVPGTTHAVGDLVFPMYDTTLPRLTLPPGAPFYYRCIGGNDADSSGDLDTAPAAANEPNWPRVAGLNVTDNEVVWQAVDNRKPLRAIQLTILFQDPSTQQLRTLTMVHSLVD